MNGGILKRFRVRLGAWQAASLVLALAGLACGVAAAAILTDAAIDFSDRFRALLPWCMLAALGAFTIWAFWCIGKLDEFRIARLWERSRPELGSKLSNAVQLAQASGGTDVQEYLRHETIQLGSTTAKGLSAWPMARSLFWKALLLLVVAGVLWGGLLRWGDDVLRVVWPRFTDPYGDHPPYSQLALQVSPGKTEVLYGSQVDVRAVTSGRPVNKLWLVARSGSNETRTVMFLAPDKSFFQSLVNLRGPAEYFVTDGGARSRRFPVSIRYTPQITLVEVTTDFPDYTSKTRRTGKLTDETQSLPVDTKVSFRVASNRPLKSGEILLTPILGGTQKRVALAPSEQEQMVTGSFSLTEPVQFAITVRDKDGLICAEPKGGRFNLLPDEKPRLFVLEPGRDAVATPNFKVPVRLQATDDYGISRVVWLRGHNRSLERPFQMKVALKSGPQSVEATGAFELEKLGVRPGDVIEYYFEAADNYPKGPNLALSRIYKLDIISKEDYERILRQAAARKALFEPYFKMSAWLRRMAERARELEKKSLAANPQDKDAIAKEAKQLQEDLEKYQEQLGKLLGEAAMFDIEQSFRQTLVEQHNRSGQALSKFKKSFGNGQPGSRDLRELSDELKELSQTEQEDVSSPGEQIASVARVLAKADQFVKLAQAEAAIARMLERFADKTGGLSRVEQIEMQELTHRQKRVQEELGKVLTSLAEQIAAIPQEKEYEPLRDDVQKFIKAVEEAKIDQELRDSIKAMGEPDTMTAHALAKSAAEKMAKLIGQCNGLPQNGKQCLTARFKPKISNSLGKTMEQIMAAMGMGSGQGGRDGYSLFNDDVALYGPNVELAGEQAGGRSDSAASVGQRGQRLASDAKDPGLKTVEATGRVRLQPDAKFPLRYRELVGEYFKAIAETQDK